MPALTHDTTQLIRKHALLNAYKHKGVAHVNAVLSKALAERPELRSAISELRQAIEQIVGEVNSLSPEDQLNSLRTGFPEALEEPKQKPQGKALPALSNAVRGAVVTRFPPEPNGPLHIGHAKAVLIDEAYARMYDGKFILRFDDTNPANEKLEFYGAIRDSLDWLGVRPDIEKNTSDDLELLYDYAEKLIRNGHAYACTCELEAVRRNRADGTECIHRSNAIDTNLNLWRRMFTDFKANEAILRLRVDMRHRNTALRDPTLFRIIDTPHPLKKRKYRVWPTYDFAVSVEDHLDGVTHAMRSKEYELRDELYYLIIDLLALKRPQLIEFSRLELQGAPLSKRKLKPLVEKHLVHGWDDPRLPTLAGLRRRGYAPEGIRQYVIGLGVSKVESLPTWDLLESFNRKALDPIAKRYIFVPNPVRLEVSRAPRRKVSLRYHPDKDYGQREIETEGLFYVPGDDLRGLSKGDMFRLIELYNVRLLEQRNGNLRGEFAGAELIPNTTKVQWVTQRNINFTVKVLGPLFVNEQFDPSSLKIVKGLAEESCRELKPGTQIQLLRFGFCRVDEPGVAILTHR